MYNTFTFSSGRKGSSFGAEEQFYVTIFRTYPLVILGLMSILTVTKKVSIDWIKWVQTVERGLCMCQRRVNLVSLAELSMFSNEPFRIKNYTILTFGQTWVAKR